MAKENLLISQNQGSNVKEMQRKMDEVFESNLSMRREVEVLQNIGHKIQDVQKNLGMY